jgi:hypothetical protein
LFGECSPLALFEIDNLFVGFYLGINFLELVLLVFERLLLASESVVTLSLARTKNVETRPPERSARRKND